MCSRPPDATSRPIHRQKVSIGNAVIDRSYRYSPVVNRMKARIFEVTRYPSWFAELRGLQNKRCGRAHAHRPNTCKLSVAVLGKRCSPARLCTFVWAVAVPRSLASLSMGKLQGSEEEVRWSAVEGRTIADLRPVQHGELSVVMI